MSDSVVYATSFLSHSNSWSKEISSLQVISSLGKLGVFPLFQLCTKTNNSDFIVCLAFRVTFW